MTPAILRWECAKCGLVSERAFSFHRDGATPWLRDKTGHYGPVCEGVPVKRIYVLAGEKGP